MHVHIRTLAPNSLERSFSVGGEKAVGKNASLENTQSNQDKVDVKMARRHDGVWIKTISVFVRSVIRVRE